MDAIQVGDKRQLLFDTLFLDTVEDVRLTMHPAMQDTEPLVVPDKPWESYMDSYNTVLLEDGVFRLWYGVRVGQKGRLALSYAQSNNGLDFEKPNLGLIDVDGSKENNVVSPTTVTSQQQGGTVFRDDRAPTNERYRLWTKYQPGEDDRKNGIPNDGLWTLVSPDGYVWRVEKDKYKGWMGRVFNNAGAADTQSIPFWDEDLQKYVGFMRAKKWPKGRERTCSVGIMTSDDFVNWTPITEVFGADELDEPALVRGGIDDYLPVMDFYTPGGMKLPGVPNAYIILPTAFFHWERDHSPNPGDDSVSPWPRFPTNIDIRLATSRDLVNWWQHESREPFLRLGIEGEANGGCIYSNPWPIPVGNELWFYYTGAARSHDGYGTGSGSGLFRSRIRRDGFVSVDAPYTGGQFTTPKIVFSGEQLCLNMDGSAGGWLQVELLDDEGHPIPGYTLADCDTIRGNALDKPVTWKGQGSVAQLAEKPIRMRFVMRSMRLYAFQFSPGEA